MNAASEVWQQQFLFVSSLMPLCPILPSSPALPPVDQENTFWAFTRRKLTLGICDILITGFEVELWKRED